jgi:hypothetical protein
MTPPLATHYVMLPTALTYILHIFAEEFKPYGGGWEAFPLVFNNYRYFREFSFKVKTTTPFIPIVKYQNAS